MNTLITKLLKNNNNFFWLCLMPVGLFCNDDTTPPSPKNITQKQQTKTKQTYIVKISNLPFPAQFWLDSMQPFSILGGAEVPSPKVESFYMELQPTQIQQTTRDSEYGSLMKNPEGDSDDAKTKQGYANAAVHRLPKPRENEVYQNI